MARGSLGLAPGLLAPASPSIRIQTPLVTTRFEQGRIHEFGGRGVESGNVLARRTIPELESAGEPHLTRDRSANAFIRRYRRLLG